VDAVKDLGVQALAFVLPAGTPPWPASGIAADSIAIWRHRVATGVGIGRALYKPEMSIAKVRERARSFVSAC